MDVCSGVVYKIHQDEHSKYLDNSFKTYATDNDNAIDVPDCWETVPVSRRTSPATNSGAALETIQAWLKECLSGIDPYCTSPVEARLPTRVIDVRLTDGVVSLVESRGAVASYIYLSHCWGLAQIITTTRSTLQDRKAGILEDALSNTFRDAIWLTRCLGIPYIWIDSLCILQDDRRDWELESARMSEVYSNSYLTIAATASRYGHGGLFREAPDFPVHGTTHDGSEFTLYFRERIDHHLEEIHDPGEVGHPTLYHYPLLTRAWVYQERMLSTRVLHFGHHELFFECRSGVQCECGQIAFHGSSDAAPAAVTKIPHDDALGSPPPVRDVFISTAAYYVARFWRTMVSSYAYACLGLTKPSDRLPAMGGLAKHMAARRKNSAYLAGLWEDAISDDLLWSVCTPSTMKKARPYPPTAPTWSWASVATFVLYSDEILSWDPDGPGAEEPRRPCEHFARVGGFGDVPGAVDEFGAIKEGRITISGALATGVLGREVKEGKDGEEVIANYVVFGGEPGPGQTLPGSEVSCLRMSRLQVGGTDIHVSLVLRPVVKLGSGSDKKVVSERIGTIRINAGLTPAVAESVGLVYGSAAETGVLII
ncbi:heterokaryon incompatibility protein-domain-containing protein [Lasiosphaeris hirsuta]|uniref:Heterokaryon incompatibility protein-domain-containing protein n=1 Tax=Lasiosphaeris hirsuta TaxID=260670 RepID=A0AA40A7P8_9PEZI|nr:heterokaryon incompatibility protein-domain-containing protein [Lasiosphaeris hirsuta]